MHILVVAPYMPYPLIGGGRLRLYSILKMICQQHQVSLLAFTQSVQERAAAAELRSLGIQVHSVPRPQIPRERGWTHLAHRVPFSVRSHSSPEMRETIARLTQTEDYDVLHVEEAAMLLNLAGQNARTPVILSHQKIAYWFHWHLAVRSWRSKKYKESLYALAETLKWFRFERFCSHWLPSQVVMSDLDRVRLARAARHATISVVPSEIDTDYYRFATPPPPDSQTLVFVGSMNYQPNVDGAQFFQLKILPQIQQACPRIEFLVVGRNPTAAIRSLGQSSAVTVVGEVPDVRPYVAQSLMTVVPVRIGGGIRTKILESMAMGRPVVSTTAGAEGIRCTHRRDIMLANSSRAFSNCVVELMSDRNLWNRIAAGGRELVVEQYTSHRITPRLLDAYKAASRHSHIQERVQCDF